MSQKKVRGKKRRPARARRDIEENAMTPQHTQRLYKLPKAAEMLDMALNTLRARIRDGSIAVVYTGPAGSLSQKGQRVAAEEIDRYIAGRSVRHTPAPAPAA